MSCPSRSVRILSCALVLLAGLAAVPSDLARAQEEEPAYRLDLISQPVWHRPSDPLDIRLRISNDSEVPIEGFLLSLTAHTLVTTRSALHLSFEGTPGAVGSAISQEHDDEIPPGGSASIVLDEPVSSLSSLAGISEGGVYPLTITISDSGVARYGEITTPLIVYPSEPEVPLNLALVLPLNGLPSRGPDGSFRPPVAGGPIPMEEAVSEGGWLSGLMAALEAEAGELPPLERRERLERPRRRPNRRAGPRFRTVEIPQEGLRLGLAPTPRFVEELADAADGYRRAGEAEPGNEEEAVSAAASDLLTNLADLLGESGIQPLAAPYSFPDLPALIEHAPERVSIELEEGAGVIESELDLELDRGWLFPPAGRLDARTLEELRFDEPDLATNVLFQPRAFEGDSQTIEVGCPESFTSFTCPVMVRTAQGPTTGLVADPGLQDRFVQIVNRGDDQLDLQRFFAETAAIRQELPSIGDRVAHTTVPSLWHPSPRLWMQFLSGLRAAPWLQTVTPSEAVELREPVVRTEELAPSFEPLANEPEPSFFEELEAGADLVERFRRMQPPEQLLTRLRRNILVAESRLWWPSLDLMQAAQGYIDSTEVEIEQQIEKVTIGGPEQINLTSQQGEIPLVVSNGTTFPTIVRVGIRSLQPDLTLSPEELEPQRINAGDAFQFTIQAASRSSGIFPVEVVVETPDGELEIATKQITVRSTEFNRVALGVTLGAFSFLVLFYVLRLFRRRRREAPE